MSAAEALDRGTLDGSYLGYGPVSPATFNLALRVVRRAGVGDLLERYRQTDAKALGGRPLKVNREAGIVLMFLVVLEGGRAAHATAAANLAAHRLTDEQRALLGLPAQTRRESKKVWIDRMLASLDSTFRLIDPYWVENRRMPYLKTEWASIVASRDPERVELLMSRLYEVMNRLARSSTEELPHQYRAKFKGHRAVDGTSWKSSCRGTSKKRDIVSVEPNAWWYRRKGDHKVEGLNVSLNEEKPKFFGYEATLFCWTKNKTSDPDEYPFIVDAVGFNPPGQDPDEVTVRAARTLFESNSPISVLRADRQYWVGQARETFHFPMWEMGFEACTDLKKDQYGLQGDPVHGMVRLDGDWYCQSIRTKRNLISASLDYREGRIDSKQVKERMDARALYLISDKQKPGADGTRVLQCPAVRGVVDCPIKRDRLPLPPVTALPLVSVTSAGKVCDNTRSVTVAPEHRSRFEQKYRLHTEEWFDAYGQRNQVESYNKDLKETPIGSKGGFRLRGYAANYFLLTLCTMTTNIHRINNFLARQAANKPRRGRKKSVNPFSSVALRAALVTERGDRTDFGLPLVHELRLVNSDPHDE